jgi:uncharacterized protein (DUF1697 family)
MEKNTKILLLIGGVLVGVVLLIIAVAGLIFWGVWQATAAPVEAVRAQLEAINQEDYERAHSYFSARLRELRTAEEFRAFVEENRAALKTTDSTFSNRSIQNDVATLRGTLTGRDGRVTPVRYVLVKENERWVIDSFRFGPEVAEEEE